MSEFVEGEWKDFVFKMITKEDHPKVLENLLQVFCRDEPLLATARASEDEEMLSDFAKFAALTLEQNETDQLSFCALDKSTGEIAGLRVTFNASRDDPKDFPFELKSKIMKGLLYNMVESLGAEANIFERYGVEHYAELMFTSVGPEYRGQGLVTEIYKRSFDLLRAKGYPLCKSSFSSPYTQKLAIRFGFTEHARRKFADFKYPDGTPIFDKVSPAEQEAILMALKL